MKDLYPSHTPYAGPLPVSVLDNLNGHPDRRVVVQPIPAHPDFPESLFCTTIFSEHGWPLSSHRRSGSTKAAALKRLHHSGDIQHVDPRASESGTYWC